MKFWLKEKQYRILEIRKNGKVSFFPQEQHLYFFWKSIIRSGYNFLKEEFGTLGQAKEFLFTYQQDQAKRDIAAKDLQREQKFDKTTSHPFNAVFYKLKKQGK